MLLVVRFWRHESPIDYGVQSVNTFCGFSRTIDGRLRLGLTLDGESIPTNNITACDLLFIYEGREYHVVRSRYTGTIQRVNTLMAFENLSCDTSAVWMHDPNDIGRLFAMASALTDVLEARVALYEHPKHIELLGSRVARLEAELKEIREEYQMGIARREEETDRLRAVLEVREQALRAFAETK